MASTQLKKDLTSCLINFDRRVLVTEFLDDYNVPFEEAINVFMEYLKEQEKTQEIKYEKSYMVYGHLEDDNNKEIYKIVKEENLKEWLKKLKTDDFCLYSAKVAGGAKAAAAVFKPMSIEDGAKLRVGHQVKVANGAQSTSHSVPLKKETIIESKKPEPVNCSSKSPMKTVKSSAKKVSPKTETFTKKSPKTEESPKKSKEKPGQKKGINNFFASAASTKKSEDTNDNKTTAVVKPPTPKKMEDFFKKQTEKPKSDTDTNPSVNTSIQLFKDEDSEVEVASSDEEEKLDALKRDLISSDVEMEDTEGQSMKATTSKRRRILDSDDEVDDNPPVKQEKLDIEEPEEVKQESSPQLDETYLDDEGFVITKKSKQKAPTTTSKSKITTKSPPVAKKISPKESKKSSATTTKDPKVSNPSAKTKQAGIMNFFAKK